MASTLPSKYYPDLFQKRSWTLNQGLDETAAATVLGGGSSTRSLFPLFTATRDTFVDEIVIRADAIETSANKTIAFFKADSGTVLSSGTQVTSHVAITSNATVAPGKTVAAAFTNKTLIVLDTTGAITTGAQVPASECILGTTNISGTITRNRNLIKAGQTFGFVTFNNGSATALALLDALTVNVTTREARA